MPRIIEVASLEDPRLDVYARLTERQLTNRAQPDQGLFIAESPLVIHRALDGGYEPVSLLMERRHVETQAASVIARCGDVPVFVSDLETLKNLTGYYLTRGVLCAMRRRPLPSVEEVCAGARRVVVLENVMNTTNVGAILRSAAALAVDAALLTPQCCDPLYRRSVRVSMGTVFQFPWTKLGEDAGDWPHPGLERLAALGFRTVAMALREDALPIDDPRLRAEEKLAIVLGTEGEGLADGTIAACDYTARVPMSHGVDSLNVAAASAVAFWELCRR